MYAAKRFVLVNNNSKGLCSRFAKRFFAGSTLYTWSRVPLPKKKRKLEFLAYNRLCSGSCQDVSRGYCPTTTQLYCIIYLVTIDIRRVCFDFFSHAAQYVRFLPLLLFSYFFIIFPQNRIPTSIKYADWTNSTSRRVSLITDSALAIPGKLYSVHEK